jgi:hypothetical protein
MVVAAVAMVVVVAVVVVERKELFVRVVKPLGEIKHEHHI